MPVYNSEVFLEQAILSILNQTYKNFEFIIIYDESSDNSLSIIKKFKELDKRIILKYGVNEKLIGALNKGIKASKGKYIARMDADDISLPNRFEDQIKFIEKYELDICGCQCLYVNEYNKEIKIVKFPIKHEMCFLSLALMVPFAHPSVIIRKKFLKNNQLLYGKNKYTNAEDLDLWINMSELNAKFGNIDKVLFRYRVTSDSLSSTNKLKVKNETNKLTSSFFNNNKNEIVKIINKNFFDLSQEEEILKARIIFKIMSLKLFKKFKYLKIKNIIYGLLKQIKNYQKNI